MSSKMVVSKKVMNQRLVELSALMRNNGMLTDYQRITFHSVYGHYRRRWVLVIEHVMYEEKELTGTVSWGQLCVAVDALEALGINGQEMRA